MVVTSLTVAGGTIIGPFRREDLVVLDQSRFQGTPFDGEIVFSEDQIASIIKKPQVPLEILVGDEREGRLLLGHSLKAREEKATAGYLLTQFNSLARQFGLYAFRKTNGAVQPDENVYTLRPLPELPEYLRVFKVVGRERGGEPVLEPTDGLPEIDASDFAFITPYNGEGKPEIHICGVRDGMLGDQYVIKSVYQLANRNASVGLAPGEEEQRYVTPMDLLVDLSNLAEANCLHTKLGAIPGIGGDFGPGHLFTGLAVSFQYNIHFPEVEVSVSDKIL